MIVAEALTWLDTPFHHQGRRKGAAVDCIGLVIGIARAFGFDKAAGFDEFTGYSKSPDHNVMAEQLQRYLTRISVPDALTGDILHFSFIGFPQHVAIKMPGGKIIHAHEPDKRVVHHGLSGFWASRVMGAYRYKGLA